MTAISAADMKYNAKLESIRAFFGMDVQHITRADGQRYQQETGNQIPARFWHEHRVAHGMFALQKPSEPVHVKQSEVAKIVEVEQPAVNMAHVQAKPLDISRFEYDKLIPHVKDTYVPWGNHDIVEQLLKSGQFFTLYVTGDSGSGKNEMIAQACAKLKRPMVRVSITRDTKEDHIIGSKTMVNGNIVYEEGPAKWCAENGAVLLLDEISLAEPNEIMSLQSILEGEPFFVKSANELVTPKPGFCIIATDNTKGRGSDSGRYIGTNILNDAFLERFEMTMQQDYPSERVERKIIERLMAKQGLTDDAFVERLIKWIHSIRKVYLDEGIEEHITTRRASHIVKTYAKLGDSDLAVKLCTARFDETTHLAMLSLWEKMDTAETEPPVVKQQTEDEVEIF